MLNEITVKFVTCDGCNKPVTFVRNVLYFTEEDTMDVIDECLNNGEWFSSTWNGKHRSMCESCAKCDRCDEYAWDLTESGEFLCENHLSVGTGDE